MRQSHTMIYSGELPYSEKIARVFAGKCSKSFAHYLVCVWYGISFHLQGEIKLAARSMDAKSKINGDCGRIGLI